MRGSFKWKFISGALLLGLVLAGSPACGLRGSDAASANEDAASILGLVNTPEPGPDQTAALASAGALTRDLTEQQLADEHYVWARLKRVRYCDNWVLGICTHHRDHDHLQYWSHAGVSENHREDLFLAEIFDAPRANAENIIFMAAGQQPSLLPSDLGVTNVITGQPKNYKTSCTKECAFWLDSRSLAVRTFKKWQLWHGGNTQFTTVFDTKFNYLTATDEKARMENAYYTYLTERADPAKVKKIYLSGSSRGGCLVMRLAKRLRQDPNWRQIPLLVHTVDGVCNHAQDELVTDIPAINPLVPVRFGWRLNAAGHYPYHTNLRMFQVATGDSVVLPGVRGFSFFPGGLNAPVQRDEGWIAQRWGNMLHIEVGRYYDYAKPFLDAFSADIENFDWSGSTSSGGSSPVGTGTAATNPAAITLPPGTIATGRPDSDPLSATLNGGGSTAASAGPAR